MVLRISVRRRQRVAAAMVRAINQHVTLAGCAHLAEGDLLRIGSHGSAPYQRTMHFETIVADVVSGLGWPDWVPGVTPKAPRAYQRARPRSLSPLIGAVAVRPVHPGPDKKLGARPRLRARGGQGEASAVPGPRISAKHGPAGTSRRSGVSSDAWAVLRDNCPCLGS